MQESESDRVFDNVFVDNLEVEHNYYYTWAAQLMPMEILQRSHATRSLEVRGRWMRSKEEGRGKTRNWGVRGRAWKEDKMIMG